MYGAKHMSFIILIHTKNKNIKYNNEQDIEYMLFSMIFSQESHIQLIFLVLISIIFSFSITLLHYTNLSVISISSIFLQKFTILVYVLLLIVLNKLLHIQPYIYAIYIFTFLHFLPEQSYIKKRLMLLTIIFTLVTTFFKSDEISKLLSSTLNINYESLFSTTLHTEKLFYLFISLICTIFCYIFAGTIELTFLMSCITTSLFFISANTWHEFTLGYEILAIITTFFLFFSTKNDEYKSKSTIRYATIHFLSGFLLIAITTLNHFNSEYLEFDFIKNISDIQKYCLLISMLIGAGIFPFSSWVVDSYFNTSNISRIILFPFLSKIILLLILHIFIGNKILFILGICTISLSIIFLLFCDNINKILLYASIGYTGICSLIIGKATYTYEILVSIGKYIQLITTIFLLLFMVIFVLLKSTKLYNISNFVHYKIKYFFIGKIAITLLSSIMLLASPLYLYSIFNIPVIKNSPNNTDIIYMLLQISHIIIFTLSFGKILISTTFNQFFNTLYKIKSNNILRIKIFKEVQFSHIFICLICFIATIYLFNLIKFQNCNNIFIIILMPIIICIFGYKFLIRKNKTLNYDIDYIYRIIIPHIIILLNKLSFFISNYLHTLFVKLFYKMSLTLEGVSAIRDRLSLKFTILSSFVIILFCIYIRILCLAP